MPLPRYKCHKEVEAAKIIGIGSIDGRTFELTPTNPMHGPIRVDREYMQKHKPVAPGYFVRYADGYESWSPVEAFEEGYTRIDESTP